MNIAQSITEIIGKTPLMRANNLEKELGLNGKLLLKLEYLNPAGSVKDRAALYMIEDAERSGRLTKDSVIIEPTSGNTGIGLAAIAASRGYRVVLTMPETMSVERRKLLAAYGAEIVLTDGKAGMRGAIEKADELTGTIPGAFVMGQFVNPANAEAHYCTTGPEIWEQTDGNLDYFIAGVGTGGTITGTGRYLKEKNPGIQIIAVEPDTSPVLSEGKSGSHKLQGIGAGFVPQLLDTSVYDSVMKISAEEAFNAARILAKKEGVLVGISSGAALAGAVRLCRENPYKTVVALLPDTGDRYLSTELF